MNNISKLLKNVVLFLVIFVIVQYAFSFFQDEQGDILINSGNVLFATEDATYPQGKTVDLKILNSTDQDLVIPNECPEEPFSVFKKINNKWEQITASPELNCDKYQEITLAPNEETRISYSNWNNALFGDLGIYKIEFTTVLNDEETTLSTNEFTIERPGVIRQVGVQLFYKPIYNALIFIASLLPNHDLGLAIIILTIIIRTILLVPSHRAMKAQSRMQEIQPRLEKIREKYKGDQQRIAMETMAVWKEANVKPTSSCLPLLLQFPFLIAIFYVIQDGLNPDNAHLLYTTYENFTLSDINSNFFGVLELTEINTYILPIVIGGLQFIQMQLTMARARKKKKSNNKKQNEIQKATNAMMYIMPVLIAVFTATLPAGVGIYWGTSTVYGIIQQIFINRNLDSGKGGNGETKVRVIEAS